MNHDKTPSVVGIVRGLIQGHAFEKTVRVRGKGYMAALRQLHPGEEVFLSGAHNANQLARLVFGKGNYRTHRTPEGTYVAYTPHNVERCPTCGAVRHADHDRPSPAGPLVLQILDSSPGERSLACPAAGQPMNQILDISVALDAIRRAFKPLLCRVEVYDSERRLRFRVLDSDNKPVLPLVDMSMRDAVDPNKLRAEIDEARRRVEAKGCELKAWTPPS